MSDTILSGDVTIHWFAEDRQGRIEWTGSGTGTRTMNELYSAFLKKMSQLQLMSEGTPMRAVTDAVYQIGMFDAGAKDPWFVDRETMEHFTGTIGLPMSLSSVGWQRVTDTNTGIIKIELGTIGALDQNDIGDTCTHTSGDTGTILDINQTTLEVYIRPTDDTSSNDWDTASGTFDADTSNNTSGTVSVAAVSAGESIWAGVESIANQRASTRPIVYQDGVEIIAYKGSDKWWFDGHINTNFFVQDLGTLIDEGYVTVISGKYDDTFNFWILNLSNGKPAPAPLGTGQEPRAGEGPYTNYDGYQQFITDAESGGGWSVSDIGEVFQEVSNVDNQAIMTSISGTGPDYTVQYFLIGSLENFGASDVLEDTGQTKTMTMTASTPTDAGPAALAGLSITYTSDSSLDINEDGTNEYFSVVIDCNSNLLADVFEWLKYTKRRGNTGTGDSDGQEAESYIGVDYVIEYTGTIGGGASEGDVVTQLNTLATGTIVAIHTTPKIVILRSSRGTFEVGTDDLEVTSGNGLTDPTVVTPITPVASCPWGTMPGAVFTGAQGVALTNVHANDANNYTLTDDEFNSIKVPTKVPISLSDTRLDDKLAVYELDGSGGAIVKTSYTVDTIASIGDTSISVDPNILDKVPGKTVGGVLFVVDVDANVEYRYRYASWSGDDFTLFGIASATATGGDSDTLLDSGNPFGSVEVGDIILNETEGVVAYVLEVVGVGELRTTPVTDWNGDDYTIGYVAVALSTSDKIYVPYVSVHEDTGTDGAPGTETAEVVYPGSPIYIVFIARNSEDGGSYNIEPFAIFGSIGPTGFPQAVIRNPDTIIT